MPIIHFAFGGLHREGKHQEQLNRFIECIVMPKEIRSFACPEFMPILTLPGGQVADMSSAVPLSEGGTGITFERYTANQPVTLICMDYYMASFVDIPLKKLSRWPPADHYGRLGLAFTDAFRRKAGVKSVGYYPFEALDKDPRVIELNREIWSGRFEQRMDYWHKEFLPYRKPAFLWESFQSKFYSLKVTATEGGATIEKQTYSRYPVGYNFQDEREARVVTNESSAIPFEESDVLCFLVPSEPIKVMLEECLSTSWRKPPPVQVIGR